MTQTNTAIEQLFLWNNPDFNEVLIFYGLEAISFRHREKAKELLDKLKSQLMRIKSDNWPYKKPIMIVIEINGPSKKYSRRDVDNMGKVILDAGNKIIYDDDRLINILIVQKRVWEKPLYGFHLAVRAIDVDKKDKYSTVVCFASKTEPDIHKSQTTQPIIFYFENEADTEYVSQFNISDTKASDTRD